MKEGYRLNSHLKRALPFAAACLTLPVLAVAPGHASRRQKAIFRGVNYAHRGLHSRDRSVPENSLAAFRLAAREGYGIELDVQLSRDGQVVVFHDDTLDRVCGVHARVDEKSYEELSGLRLCGTDERIHLFSEVLQSIRGCEALVVELKNGYRNRELCEKTKALLAQIHGIELQYSTEPGFPAENTVKVSLGKKKTKLVLKGLQPKTAYYVRVRYTDGEGG